MKPLEAAGFTREQTDASGRRRSRAGIAITASLSLLGLPSPSFAGIFVTLPSPAGNGGAFPRFVSWDGRTVVGQYDTDLGPDVYRWTADSGIQRYNLIGGSFDGLPVHQAYGTALLADGTTLVGYMRQPPPTWGGGFLWNGTSGFTGIGTDPLRVRSTTRAATSDGSVIVGQTGNGWAYRWTASGGMEQLPALAGSTGSTPRALSATGDVVVGGMSSVQPEPFLWSAGTGMVGLGLLPNAHEGWAVDVSSDGEIVTGTMLVTEADKFGKLTLTVPHVFRWSMASGLLDLGPGNAAVISDASGAIVWTSSAGTMVWEAGVGSRSLEKYLAVNGDDPLQDGWTRLDGATAWSPDGRFVLGTGTRNGKIEWYMADMAASVPESPWFALSAAAGLAAFAGWRRRPDAV